MNRRLFGPRPRRTLTFWALRSMRTKGGPGPLHRALRSRCYSALRYAVASGVAAARDVAFAAPYALADAHAPVHLDAVRKQLRAGVGLQLPQAQPLGLAHLCHLHLGFHPLPPSLFLKGRGGKAKTPRPLSRNAGQHSTPASRSPHHRRSLLGKARVPVLTGRDRRRGEAYRGVLVETEVSPVGECIPHRTGA